jgi:antitoxin component YwqK of YwqJK toxin-antitoxin module
VDGIASDDTKPCYVTYYESGQIWSQEWYKNNRLGRDRGPAITEFYESGQVKSEQWYHNDVRTEVKNMNIIPLLRL